MEAECQEGAGLPADGTGTGGWVVNRGVSCVAGRELGVQKTGGQTGI